MSNDFLQARPTRHRRIMVAGCVGALLLTVMALQGRYFGSQAADGTSPEQAPAPTAVTTPSPSSQAGDEATNPAPAASRLRLVRGRHTANGVQVGYPHSRQGAVSAAVEYWTQLATLDPDRKAAIGREIADANWAGAADFFANGALKTRRSLGLSATEDVPPGASIQVTPMNYQLRHESRDSVTVLLLSYLVTTTPQAGTVSRSMVAPLGMRWDGLDWKVVQPQESDPDYAETIAKIGTPRVQELGWLEMSQ